jgi:hypothetical protein
MRVCVGFFHLWLVDFKAEKLVKVINSLGAGDTHLLRAA